MATRVRKPDAAKTAEPAAEPAATTRRRATQSRTAATRRTASSSRSQRIVLPSDLAEAEKEVTTPSVADSAPALEVAESPQIAPVAKEEIAVSPTPIASPDAVADAPFSKKTSAKSVSEKKTKESHSEVRSESKDAGVSTETSSVLQRLSELQKLVTDGQDRSLAELQKTQTQMVRNLSGLSRDVDKLLKHVQELQSRLAQSELVLSRVESTLGPLSRGVSSLVMPAKPLERPLSPDVFEKSLGLALAPILAELVELRAQRARDSSLAQVEQQILMTELRRLRNVGLSQIERNTDPLSSVGKTGRRTPSKL